MLAARGCADGRHAHVPKRRADAMVRNFEAVWLDENVLRRTGLSLLPMGNLRDTSSKLGEFFAACFRERQPWAICMLRQIQLRWERTGYESPAASDVHAGVR